MASLIQIVRYLDTYLRVCEIEDWPNAVTGALYRQLKLALENDIALYSAHLPLDIHPKVGNTAQLATAIGLKSTARFFKEKGELIGLKARASLPREELIRKLRRALA